jgi:hypothetical protein
MLNDRTNPSAEPIESAVGVTTKAPQTTWRPFSPRGPTPLTPPQFGLRALLIGTGIIAVFLGLSRLIHIWALVLAFMIYVGARIIDYGRGEPVNSRKRWIYDFIKGVLLPIGCLFYDPGFFGQHAARVIGWGVFGSQMAVFTVWLMMSSRMNATACGFFAGFLRFGSIAAVLVALVLTPFTIIGLFAVIGVLGFVPYLTAATYSYHGQNAWYHAGAGRDRTIAVTCGFVAALTVGLAAWSVCEVIPRDWLKPPRPTWLMNWPD